MVHPEEQKIRNYQEKEKIWKPQIESLEHLMGNYPTNDISNMLDPRNSNSKEEQIAVHDGQCHNSYNTENEWKQSIQRYWQENQHHRDIDIEINAPEKEPKNGILKDINLEHLEERLANIICKIMMQNEEWNNSKEKLLPKAN